MIPRPRVWGRLLHCFTQPRPVPSLGQWGEGGRRPPIPGSTSARWCSADQDRVAWFTHDTCCCSVHVFFDWQCATNGTQHIASTCRHSPPVKSRLTWHTAAQHTLTQSLQAILHCRHFISGCSIQSKATQHHQHVIYIYWIMFSIIWTSMSSYSNTNKTVNTSKQNHFS